MKLLFRFLIVCCCFSTATVQAQELRTTVIADETFEVSVIRKKLQTYSFLAGDTIVISISETEGRELSKFIIEDVNSSFKKIAEKVTATQERMIIAADTDFNLILDNNLSIKNPLGFKRSIHVNIVKEEYFVPEVIEVNDFVETEAVTISNVEIKLTQSDTIFTPAVNEIIALGSKIEPGKRTRKALELTPVPEATYYVYWIGVGQKAIADYEQLKMKMPGGWAALGIVEPIDAYAMGKIRQMPIRPEGEKVYFAITGETDKNKFTAHQKFNQRYEGKGVVSYGIIDAAYVPLDRKTFICLGNDNQVSGINLSVKVVAVTINNTYEEIITDTVITVNKVFRLNTEALSIAEAKAALTKAEKELAAARVRAVKEHIQAQHSLDSAWVVRQAELDKAAENLELARNDVDQKQIKVNNVMEEQIQAKIMALNDNDGDSAVVVVLQSEIEALLAEYKKVQQDVKEMEQKRLELQELMKADLKTAGLKEVEKIVDETAKKEAGEIGKKVTETILEGVDKTKEILKKGEQ